MKKPLQAALAVALLSLSLSGCQTFKQIIGKVQVAITEGDKLVAENKNIFIDACASGEAGHVYLRNQMTVGIIKLSAKDDANEMALYNKGLALCASVPDDLASLYAKIPAIKAWLKQVAILAGKVS